MRASCGVLVLMAMAAVLPRPSWADDDVRMCYKCRGRDSCMQPEFATVETCSPDVQRCVTKFTVSKVTGARVSEQYCGSPEVLEDRLQVLEDKCYSSAINQDDRRTHTTFCYCSWNLCNGATPSAPPSWSFFGVLVLALLATSTTWFT